MIKTEMDDEKRWRNDGLARHLIFSLILFSSFITTLITAIELYTDYKHDIQGIDNRMQFIQGSYLPTLIESVWVADSLQINTQLDGLSRLQDIEYLAITNTGQNHWSAGKLRSNRVISDDVLLVKSYRGKDVTIGTLHIVASIDNVLNRLWTKLFSTLFSNFAKTMLIAIFMLFLFQRLAGRHLERISRHLHKLGLEPDSDSKLQLNRREQKRWRPDVLDEVVNAVNSMQSNVNTAHTQILQLNTELEQRVQERTNDLARQNRRIELILDTTVDGFFAADVDGHILDVNPAFCMMLGYSREELLQLSIADVEGNENSQEVANHIANVFAKGHDRFDTRHRRKDGSLIHVEISVNLVRLMDENIVYAFVRDISERKQAEHLLVITKEEAEQASLAKSEFLSSMSHELRTPMNAILGFSQLLGFDPTLSEQNRENVNEIINAGKHLLELINEVLDLARIESGHVELKLEAVEVNPVIEDCLRLLSTLADKCNIQINYHKLEGIVVRADRTRLKQVLLNLLSNAVKYNRDGGSVLVEIKHQEPDKIRILVSDTGPGIPAESMSELFLPFNRLNAEKSNIEGTGIGLTITRNIVELMGGKVEVESEMGIGSTFWIELPLVSNKASIPELLNSGDDVFHQTILYIDDHPSNLKLVSHLIAPRLHTRLLTAKNPEWGIELALSYRPDLILLDINMPGMDGYQVLKILKADANLKHIPVVAVTSNAMPGDIKRGFTAGFNDYLTKPLDVPHFNSVIDKFLTKTH